MWNKYYISLILQVVFFTLAQVVVVNNVRLFGFFLPILYLYPFLKMPLQMPQWSLTLIAFITGLIMDIMMNTPGINAAAVTAAVYFREGTLRALIDEDDIEENETSFIPSFRSMKAGRFITYLLICLSIHISSIMLLEAFSTHLFVHTIPYIVGSIGITLLFFFIFEALRKRKDDDI